MKWLAEFLWSRPNGFSTDGWCKMNIFTRKHHEITIFVDSIQFWWVIKHSVMMKRWKSFSIGSWKCMGVRDIEAERPRGWGWRRTIKWKVRWHDFKWKMEIRRKIYEILAKNRHYQCIIMLQSSFSLKILEASFWFLKLWTVQINSHWNLTSFQAIYKIKITQLLTAFFLNQRASI